MSGPAFGVLGFALSLVLILLRVPVGVAMGAVGIAGTGYLSGWSSATFVMGAAPFEALFPYNLSVIPLFVMMGAFAARAGLSAGLYSAANAFVGHVRGGLSVATVAACGAFGAICGSSLATVATIGRVAMPEMRRHGYDDRLASASIAAGGTLGVLIPPSIILVIYGILTETSIGALFMAALAPGVLGILLYAGAVLVQTRLNPALAPATRRQSWRHRLRMLQPVWAMATLFVVVIGGIYWGWFSPTEAAAVGAFGALLFTFLQRRLTWSTLLDGALETARTTGMIFLILIGAALFNFFIQLSGLPTSLIGAVEQSELSTLSVLILIMLFYVVLGCFMDSLSIILLTVPFLFPVVSDLGLHPLTFGILLVTVAEIGLITPPVGINLFVVQGVVPGLAQHTIVRGILPFFAADVVRLALLLLFPILTLWLPGRMAG